MHEISPVLAGTFDQPDYASAQVNFNTAASTSGDTSAVAPSATTGVSGSSGVDDRRYTKFDRTATDAGSTTNFSFSDFLDMINPLEHVPVLSSIYREVTGESINPVSRVAGDILYGGAIGMASAVLGGVGAVGDAAMESQTGKDGVGYAVASLFGDTKTESGQKIELASASSNQTSAGLSTATPSASLSTQNTQIAAAPQTGSSAQNAPSNPSQNIGAINLASMNAPASGDGKTSPLNKLPYGGVMAPVGTTPEQNMAMALAETPHSIRIGSTIYSNRLTNGPRPMPVASANAAPANAPASASPAATSPAAVTAATAATPSALFSQLMSTTTNAPTASVTDPMAGFSALNSKNDTIPQGLMDNMMMLKALNQYKSVGSATLTPGTKLDVTN